MTTYACVGLGMMVRTALSTSRSVPKNRARIVEPVMSEVNRNCMRIWPSFPRPSGDFSASDLITRMLLDTFVTVCLVLMVSFLFVHFVLQINLMIIFKLYFIF